MKSKLLVASAVALSVAMAGSPARADLIAGWDFSQWLGDGVPSIDGATFANVLSANYSSLDPTNGIGAESAAFGTMYSDGSFGSTPMPIDTGDGPYQPTSFSLTSNFFPPGNNGIPFDQFGFLQLEGQLFTEALSMTAASVLSVVFEADLTSVPQVGTDWQLTFGGQTFGPVTGLTGINVGIEFSTDGASFTPVGTVLITSLDTLYTVALGATPADKVQVRLNFLDAPQGNNQAKIDNVAIGATLVPEPGTALLLGCGLTGLVVAGRRRA